MRIIKGLGMAAALAILTAIGMFWVAWGVYLFEEVDALWGWLWVGANFFGFAAFFAIVAGDD